MRLASQLHCPWSETSSILVRGANIVDTNCSRVLIGMESNASNRTFRPTTLDECIGQDQVRRNLRIYINSAKVRNEPVEHLLLTGHAGLGKTTLAESVAAEMGGQLTVVNSPSLKTKGELASIIGQIGPGDILFLDEIHALRRDLQELMYPVLEDFKLEISAGTGAIAIPLSPFTVIGATTHQGKLSKPMRDRFGDVCELQLYRTDELATIVTRAANKMNVHLALMSSTEIAKRSQGTPRVALRIMRRIRDFALSTRITTITPGFVQQVCYQIGIDSVGLDPIARRMLKVLAEKNRAIGLQAIAAQLGEATETLEDCVEPFLLAQGFIERVQSGRIITSTGMQHLGTCGF
jgi:holliday junction DNA helicase RuvB